MADISQIKLPDGTTYDIKTEKTDKVKCETDSSSQMYTWKPIVARNSYDSTTKYGELAVAQNSPEIDLKRGIIRNRNAEFPHQYYYGIPGIVEYWYSNGQYNKPVYENIYTFDSTLTLSNNSWTNAIVWTDDIQIIYCMGLNQDARTCFNCVSAQYDATASRIKLLNTRGSNITIDAIILRYYYVT